MGYFNLKVPFFYVFTTFLGKSLWLVLQVLDSTRYQQPYHVSTPEARSRAAARIRGLQYKEGGFLFNLYVISMNFITWFLAENFEYKFGCRSVGKTRI